MSEVLAAVSPEIRSFVFLYTTVVTNPGPVPAANEDAALAMALADETTVAYQMATQAYVHIESRNESLKGEMRRDAKCYIGAALSFEDSVRVHGLNTTATYRAKMYGYIVVPRTGDKHYELEKGEKVIDPLTRSVILERDPQTGDYVSRLPEATVIAFRSRSHPSASVPARRLG